MSGHIYMYQELMAITGEGNCTDWGCNDFIHYHECGGGGGVGWVGGETGKLPPTWTLNVILCKIKVLLLK